MSKDWSLGGDVGSSGPDGMASERLVGKSPVVVRRRVLWGECDPAGVVYTPRFAEYLVAAYSWFRRTVLVDSLLVADGVQLATPMKALALDYHRVLRPDELFDMTVHVVKVGDRTFDLSIVATNVDGIPCFTGALSPIVVRPPDFGRAALPVAARDALVEYKERFGAVSARAS